MKTSFSVSVRNAAIFLISLLMNVSIGFSQTYPTVNTARPRVNVASNTQFSTITNLLVDGNEDRVDGLFHEIKPNVALSNQVLCNGPYGIDLCGPSPWNWAWNYDADYNTLTPLRQVLFYYNLAKNDTNDQLALDQSLQEDRINFITEELIAEINNFYNGPYNLDVPSSLPKGRSDLLAEFRLLSNAGALLLDWGYDAIEHSQRESLRQQLVDELWEFNYYFMKYWVYREFFDIQNYPNDNYVAGIQLNNSLHAMKLVLALYHCSELTTAQQNALGIRYRFMYDDLQNEFLNIAKFYADDDGDNNYDYNEGGQQHGATYNSYVRPVLIEYFDLISTATSHDLYGSDNFWINNLINQHFYLVKPNDETLHLGDAVQDLSNAPRSASIISLFNRFDHNKNKWMMKKYEDEDDNNFASKLTELILRDFDKGTGNPIISVEPKDWFSSRTGLYVSKTSLTDPEATMVTLTNRPANISNHEHLDNNSFQLYKNGPLFVNSGYYDDYDSDHRLDYYKRTISHNSVTIYNPNEQFIYGSSRKNDGGQIFHTELYNYSDVQNSYNNNPNAWKEFVNNENFMYAITDATSSFSSSKLDSYVKKFLYLKIQDRIITLDYIKQPTSLPSPFVTKWNAHFINQPVMDGGNPNHIITNRIIQYTNPNKITINNGTGGIAVLKTLFPSNETVQVVGGDGYRHFVFDEIEPNGQNISPILDSVTGNPVGSTEGANWRIEVKDNSSPTNNNTLFAHTIDIGSDSIPTDNHSSLRSNLAETISIKWDNQIFCFSNLYEGAKSTFHKFSIDNLTGIYFIYAFDLAPNQLYNIEKNYTNIGTVYTDNYGIIENHAINVSGVGFLSIVPYSSNESFSENLVIFPNTLKKGSDLSIVIQNDESRENELKIFNLMGQELLSLNFIGNKFLLSELNLETGTYVVVISNSDFTREKKLIVN